VHVFDMTEWNSLEWVKNARNLIEWVNSKSRDSKIMLVVRHSHREEIEDHSVQLSTELTDLGKQMSFEMGKKLPTGRPIHFFFSFVARCYQTAEEMASGFTEIGGNVLDMDPLPILVKPEIADESVWMNLQPDGRNITEFINNWADGQFGDKIEAFQQYQSRILKDTLVRILTIKKNEMHIHITHDLALMALKRILMKRAVEFEDREPFLGGFGVEVDSEGNVTYYSAGEEKIISKRDEK
jgi:broad specificity phosphatase PhoE